MQIVVGEVSEHVAGLLEIAVQDDMKIYFSDSNLAHMKKSHPADYAKYGGDIKEILKEPDYVGKNPNDGSIEYVKEYVVDGEHVKVAVRLSGGGRYYARSLYILNERRVKNFILKGTLKKA